MRCHNDRTWLRQSLYARRNVGCIAIYLTGRIDHNLSSKDQLAGRYVFNDTYEAGTPIWGHDERNNLGRTQNVAVEKAVLRDRLAKEIADLPKVDKISIVARAHHPRIEDHFGGAQDERSPNRAAV